MTDIIIVISYSTFHVSTGSQYLLDLTITTILRNIASLLTEKDNGSKKKSQRQDRNSILFSWALHSH